MESRTFFNLPDGTEARLYSLRNRSGFGADITDWGGAIVRLLTPDRDGKLTDVVLGFAEPSEYIENGPFFGALIGRVANRIAGGKFELDGKHYQLECNDTDRPNTLHGGQSYGRRFIAQILPRLDRSKLALEGDRELENGLRILLLTTLPLLCEGVLAEDPGPIRARYQSYLTILKGGMLR